MKTGAVTILDLARLAGVSHSTVSRALNGSPLVKEATRRRIQELADAHQFSFHTGARSLRGVRTGVVALIYPRVLDTFGSSLYTQQLFLELRRALEREELDTILVSAGNRETGESHVKRLIRQNRVDGFLIIHGGLSREDYTLIREQGLPAVQLHNPPGSIPRNEVDCFLTDNRAGGALAAGHLLERGCRRILTLAMAGGGSSGEGDTAPGRGTAEGASGPPAESCAPPQKGEPGETAARTEGWRQALEEAGLTPREEDILSCPCDYQAAYRLVLREEKRFRRADGLFAQADILAFGAMTALKELGIAVPGRIRVVGFDDSPLALLPPGGLTTVHQPREELAAGAAARLKALLSGEPEEPRLNLLIPPVLTVRGSSGDPVSGSEPHIRRHDPPQGVNT